MFVLSIQQHGYGEFSKVRHVVVDEAQNFRNETGEDWFKSILTILNWPNNLQQHCENTSLYIFCDQLQKIRHECCGLRTLDSNGERQMSSELFPRECRLSAVIRNSKKIYEQWEKIALEQPAFTQNNQLGIAHDYEGRDVSFVKLSGYSTNEIFSKVKETIDQILNQSYKASDVAVLFNTKGIAEQFREYLMLGLLASSPIRVTNAEVFPREGLVVDSFRRFSGLDAPVVVAVDPTPYPYYENEDKVKISLYSRAMVEFFIIA